jgi:glycerol-3-phosphate dehydrogenase
MIGGSLTRGELHYLVSRERVVRLQDVILRRTDLAFRGAVSIDGLEQVASVLAGFLGWDHDRLCDEVAATAALLRTEHGVAV